jgi:hypothetical protein
MIRGVDLVSDAAAGYLSRSALAWATVALSAEALFALTPAARNLGKLGGDLLLSDGV